MALGVKMQLINKKELEKEYSSYLDSLSKKYKLDVKINTTINEQMKQTEQNTKKNTQAQNEQNASLQELIHLRKTAQIDAQKFIQDASKYRQQEEFVNLTKKEQVQLVQMLTSAEKEHSAVLNSKANIINTINKQNEAEKQVNATIQKQIANYQELFSVKSKDLTGKYGSLVNTTDLNNLKSKVSGLTIDKYDTSTIKSFNTELQRIKVNAVNSGKALRLAQQDGNSFAKEIVKDFQKFSLWFGIGTVFMSLIHNIKDGINTVVELDASLTELNKVTDISTTQMKLFTDQAYEMGATIGRTGKEVIDATSTFAKAGFNLQESFDLSKQALLLTNIGDGITDVSEAAGSIIAVLRGYQMEATNTSHVIDLLNEVSNKYAVDTNNLTDGLQRTSGTLAQTGTSVEQLTGLLTGGYESLRNMEKVSSGLITISQRLRGISENGEQIDGLMPKLQKGFKEIAGVNIQTTNGQLRSTFDILSDMQKVWGGLNDEQRQYIGELASGVRQAPVLNAIMQNWQSVEGATQAAIDSFGSAERENAKYLDSIQGRISKFTSSTQKMWNDTINSDFIKFLVSAGTGIVDITDKVGLLNVVLAVTISYFTLFSKSMLLAPIINAATLALTGFTKSLGVTGIAALRLNTILGMFAPLAIATGILLVAKAFDAFTTSIEEQRKKVQTLSDELKNLQSTYDQLLTKENRTAQEEKYLAILEKQIEAQETLLANEAKLLVRRQYGKNADSSSSLSGGTTGIGNISESIYGTGKSGQINKDIAELQRYNEEILKLNENNKKSGKTYEDLRKKIAEKTEILSKEYDEIQKNIKVLEDANEQGSEEYKTLTERAKVIESVILQEDNLANSTNNATDSISNQAISFSDLVKTIVEARDSISDINKALDEYEENGKFSTDTIVSLIDKYPQLLKYLNDEKSLHNELIKIQSDKVKSVQDSLNLQLTSLKDNINNTFKIYQTDVDNFKNAQEAKMFIMSKLGEKILQINELIASAEYAGNPDAQYYLGSKLAALYTAKAGISKQIDEFYGLKSVDINKLVTDTDKSSSKSTSTSSEKEISEATIKADRYASLNAELERTNSLLSKNKAIQENLSGDELISKLKEEQDLLKQKQQNLNAINNERRKERSELTSYLKTQGAVFKGEGDSLDLTNAQLILQKKLDEVNSHRTDKNKTQYNKLKAEYDNLNESVKRFIELQTKDIPNASVEWWNLQKAIGSAGEEIQKVGEEQQKNLEDVQKQIVEIIKKRYEIERDEAEKAHNKVLDNLKKEKEAFDKSIDAQIEAIERKKDAEDYKDDINDLNEELSKLQNERAKYAMAVANNDTEAISIVEDLDEKIADIQEDIDDKQSDRKYELKKQALQDLKEANDEEIEDQIKTEEEKYEAIKENYDRLLEEGNLYAEANKALTEGMVTDINGKMVTVAEAFKTFSDTFGETLGTLGSNIQTEFIDKLNQALELLNTMNGLPANTGTTNNISSLNNSALSGNLLSGINLSSILDKINLTNIIPSFTMPKISTVTSGFSMGDININVAGSITDKNVDKVNKNITTELKNLFTKAGIKG